MKKELTNALRDNDTHVQNSGKNVDMRRTRSEQKKKTHTQTHRKRERMKTFFFLLRSMLRNETKSKTEFETEYERVRYLLNINRIILNQANERI